jgi:hypothetical protein
MLFRSRNLVRAAWMALLLLAAAGAVAQSTAPAPSSESVAQSTGAPGAGDGQPAEQSKPWLKTITFDGFVSGADTYNANDPASGLNQFRVFDFTDNAPELDVAEVAVQRPVAKPNDLGFRVDFLAGYSIPPKVASYGWFFDNRTGEGEHIDVNQVFLSYIVPVGKGLRLDAGKFVTPLGYEVIEGYDGYNDNYSHSFLFGYAIPYTNTGIKATYALNGKLTGMLMLTNGWDDVHDNNTAKSFGGQIAFTPTSMASLTFNFIAGPERRNDDHDWREVYEVVGTLKPFAQVTFGADALYGREDNAALSSFGIPMDAHGGGFAGYAKYSFHRLFALALRGEIFDDEGGSRTGVPQVLKEITLTPQYKLEAKWSRWNRHLTKIDGAFVLRGDLRCDFSDHNVFQTAASFRDYQFTTAVNLIYYF